MEKRFSDMDEYELKLEISMLNEKAKKAEQLGNMNEFAVYERRKTLAQSYLINPDLIEPGHAYRMKDGVTIFEVSYMNGRFAWGYRSGERELAGVPISLLADKITMDA
ncbi:YfhH family protein [Alkalihalobacillus sp. LMS6]|uniref:YfhH family protein n=1 Tax=Alkalihalobacillus sp. LMS6 TaxID=2924034 RepID=UPI0020CFFCC9|nr:YfhH family protein [Alkalihalobacillus sp. LMS6]UTR07686.1 YfhH family protein [Alkalihalobacillus sp. LMS6]